MFAAATKFTEGKITLSPFLISIDNKAKNKAEVPLLQVCANLTFRYFFKLFSNLVVNGPVVKKLFLNSGLTVKDTKGFVFNPLSWGWELSKSDFKVNYAVCATRQRISPSE